MSRIPKWKIEKTKVKVVFRLQFQATHIPQPGWDKLFVSLIPDDSGKVTAKTSKSSVRNGSCKWSDPIYETTRLLQDPKTKDYDEKFYKLVVAMGSSRSSLLGEVIINLADFVDALKPSSAALPLHGCDFGTMLHVTVQLLTSKTGFREFEQQRELSVKGFQASSVKRIQDRSEDLPATFGASEHMYKVNARVRFKGDSTLLPSLEEVGELVEDHEDSAAGVDGSSYTSESLSAEKNDFSGSAELNGLQSKLTGNVVGLMPVHGSSTEKGDHNYKHLSTQLSNDWSHEWSSDYSIDNDLVSTCDDSDRLTARLEVTESSVLQLTSEAKSLQNISNVLASETQNLAQQFAVELASGEKLAREVDMLKSECWKFKNDLDELKAASASRQIPRTETPSALQIKYFSADTSFENTLVDSALDVDNKVLPRDYQSKLLHEIFLIECKVQQIQHNSCFLYNENGLNDICSEFDHLGSLIQNLKQSIVHELSKETVSGIQTTKNQSSLVSPSDQDGQVQDAGRCFSDLYYSEGIKKEKLCEVLEQLEVSKTEDESFAKRMAKVECYYEAIIHELEDRLTQTSDQLENVRAEHSSCFYTISALQSQTEKLHEELNGQLIRFSDDRRNLESFINELEKRAISSETMLKRVRWNYAIAVDRLQKDLELLSFQVLSMYEANESLAKHAFADATEQHCDKHSEDMDMGHRDEFFVSSNKKQQIPARGEIQHDIAWVNSDNGVSEKLNHKLLHNIFSKEENKGTTETGLSMGLEHVNVNIFSAASPYDIIQERKIPSWSHDSLLEEQKNSSLLCCLNVNKPIDHSQISNNLGYMKDVSHYSSVEYSQISKNTETKENAYQYPPPEDQLLDCIVCLKEREMPVDVLKHFHVGSEAEFSEVHMLNLQLEVYAQVLQETLREVFPEIGHLNGEVFDLQKKMKHCTYNKEFLVLKLNTVLDEFRTLREAKEKDMTRYNDLVSRSHVMQGELNEILVEKNLLVQKVEDHRSLISNARVYENKYKICLEEKNELEDMLKEEKSQRTYFLSEINSVIEELKSLKEQYEKKCSLNSDLQESVTDLQGKLRDLCNWIILHNQQVESIFGDISVTEELDSENYDAIISHLEQLQQKVPRLLRFQQEKKVMEEQLEVAQCKLNERESHILYMKQKFEFELGELRAKLELSSTKIQYLQIEFQDTVEKLKLSKETEEWHRLENAKLLSSISILEVKLQQATHECQNFCQKLLEEDSGEKEALVQEKKDSSFCVQSGNEASIKMEYEFSSLKDSLHYAHEKLVRLQQGKKIAEEQRKATQCTLNERELHILRMKQKFESELEEVGTKLDHSRIEIQHLHIELQDALEKLKLSKKDEDWHRLENRKLLSNMFVLEVELQKSTDKCREFFQKSLDAESVDEELAKTKSRLADLIQENKEFLSFIHSSNEASVKLEHEVSSLKDSLHYAQNELLSERKHREELEISYSDLKLQALEMSQKLLAVNEQNAESDYLKTRDLDLEKDVQQCVVCYKETDRKINSETSSLYLEVASMEGELVASFERLISADVELIFMNDQFYSKMKEFAVHQKKSENILEELHLKHLDGVASLEKYIISEAVLMAERERLSTELLSSKSMIEVLFSEKETLLDANIVIQTEFEDLRGKAAISEASFAKEKQHYEDEVFVLRSMLLRLEELDELWLAKVELDIIVVFLHSKLSEQGTHVALFEECYYELRNLREQHFELNQKLSEQILKTEEFKNLSIHLRELKNNADAECHQVRERRESEGSSFTAQESLRIAFIKEQYESKIQELRNQCCVSRRYADEMLMKLQSSLNDNVARKKAEASLAKKNEEMSAILSDLDTELRTVATDRRDLIKAYDRMKAEVECTILSLECCKEEKQKLQICLKESNEEREKIRVELDLVKRLLENIASTTGTGVGRNYESDNPDSRLIGELLDDDPSSTSFMYDNASSTLGIFPEDKVVEAGKDPASVRVKSSPCREVDNMRLTSINRDSFMSVGNTEKILKEATIERPTLLENNATQIADIKEHFKEQQRVINGMELLHKQLQRLKNDNILSQCQLQEDHFDADLQHLHRELLQLDMVNEQLENIFPTYKMLSSYGNALERVLSLELELAESLQVKKNPPNYIQSSFLKQHNDDEAVFQSFKDINELIKDMIDLKRRNVTIESELQEMHGRYSQLSLQFAEVEGERQKLIMSLKSRTTKKS